MNEYQHELADIRQTLKEHPKGMSLGEIAMHLGLNRNSVAKYMDVLLSSGVVERRNYGRAKIYYPSSRVPLTSLMNFSSDLIITVSETLKVLHTNRQFRDFTGLLNRQLIGEDLRMLPIYEFLAAPIDIALRGRETKNEVTYAETTGAEQQHFRVKYVPTIFEDGNRGVTVILEDITKEKNAEEALSRHSFISSVLHTVAALVIVLDREGTITQFNRECERVSGYTAGEVTGKPIWHMLADEEKAGVKNIFDELAAGTHANAYENHWKTKRGDLRLISWKNTVVLNDEGEVSHIIGTGIDLTEQRSIEKELFAVKECCVDFFENGPLGFERFGPDRKFLHINKAALALLGYTREEVVGKKTWADMIAAEDLPTFEGHWQRLHKEGEVHGLRYTAVTKQGEKIPVKLYATGRFSDEGQLMYSRGAIIPLNLLEG